MLSITREEFRELYKDLNILKDEELFFSTPTSDEDLIKNYLPSKLWRLNNLYTIVDKYGVRMRFRMNRSQHKAYAALLRHPRLVILKSRQQGISTLWLVYFFDEAITRKDKNLGLMAQGTDEAEKLLQRSKLLWESLDPSIKQFLGLSIIRDNTKEIAFSTSSSLFIRTSFRSTTLQGLHVSEMGKIANKYPEKANEVKTGTLQALAQGNPGIIESTAEGDNEFKDIWDNAYTLVGERSLKDFYPLFLSWVDDPDCNVETDQVVHAVAAEYFKQVETELGRELTRTQKNFWIVQYRELGDKIYQEYPTTPEEAFRVSKLGTYYAEEFNKWVIQGGRAVPNLYDPNLDVYCAMDYGMNDTNVLVIYQRYLDTWRIIDEHANTGKSAAYYVDWMKTREWYTNLTDMDIGHDGAVRESDGKTREDRYSEEFKKPRLTDGFIARVTVRCLERTSKLDGIEAVRKIIGRLWIDSSCSYLIKCMLNYRKEWNEKLDRYMDAPLHDEHSNGADGVRYMVVGGERRTSGLLKVSSKRRTDGFAI